MSGNLVTFILNILLIVLSIAAGWLLKLIHDDLGNKTLLSKLILHNREIVEEMTQKGYDLEQKGIPEAYQDGYVDGFVEYSNKILKFLKENAV